MGKKKESNNKPSAKNNNIQTGSCKYLTHGGRTAVMPCAHLPTGTDINTVEVSAVDMGEKGNSCAKVKFQYIVKNKLLNANIVLQHLSVNEACTSALQQCLNEVYHTNVTSCQNRVRIEEIIELPCGTRIKTVFQDPQDQVAHDPVHITNVQAQYKTRMVDRLFAFCFLMAVEGSNYSPLQPTRRQTIPGSLHCPAPLNFNPYNTALDRNIHPKESPMAVDLSVGGEELVRIDDEGDDDNNDN